MRLGCIRLLQQQPVSTLMELRRRCRLAGGIALAATLGAVVTMLTACEPASDAIAPDLAKAHDRGVALMGRYEYAAAREAFAAVVEERPSWHRARVNLAIATLNRQQEGDEQLALSILAEVLAEAPGHIAARYTTAILDLYLGDAAAAAEGLRQVVAADAEDAYAAYFLGQALLQQGDYVAAADWLQRSATLDPYLRSAYWAGSQALRRSGREEEATALLADYQRFDANPAARLAGFSYGRMGPKATATAAMPSSRAPTPRPAGPLFAAARTVGIEANAGATATAADVNGDGEMDLALTGNGGTQFLLGTEDGGFAPAAAHDLAALAGIAALWGDIDDDGLLDAVACSANGVRLWRQAPAGRWALTTTLGDAPCAAAALFDADSDGDLDVFATGTNGNALYSNNRDGSFRSLAESQGLTGAAGRQVLAADLDGDRDQDILVIGDAPGHGIWQNDRTWRYRPFAGLESFQTTPLVAAATVDADADGRRELYGLTPEGALLAWRREGANWTQSTLVEAGAAAGRALDVADFDGDGSPELLRVDTAGFSVIDPRTGAAVYEQPVAGLANALAVVQDAAAGPAVAAVTAEGISWWPPGTGRHRFLALTPQGRSEAEQMRSNASGIGTLAKVRVAGRWTLLDAMDPHSGPGQSLQPLSVGLGGHDAADFVALEWSDGVTQTELDLAAGERHVIAETQRQLASCPVFFVWDGDRFAFVSDVLGGAALGYLTAPDAYAPPRPVESYLLDGDAIVPRNGRYLVKLNEPMEENAYLDAARLVVHDLPAGWSMVLDERLAVGGPPATGEPIYFRDALLPAQVANAHGEDVTALATAADRRAPSPGSREPRFVGLLTEDQTLTLTFATPLPEEDAVLVADAWIEFPYSQTVFAAWQAGRRYNPVSLHARAESGGWQPVALEFGYPGGMPRSMALPLGKLRAGTTALRLTSNMEIYWDRLRVVTAEPLPEAAPKTLGPIAARVARSGFAKRSTGPQRLPHYDYAKRAPYWDAKVPHGFYTAYGDAVPLVRDVDGALAIFGSGEEVHLEFAAPAPMTGRKRYVEVRFHGWAKDMDLYTQHGQTVGPLPIPDDLSPAQLAHRERLHARYNVRFQGGL